MKDLIVHAATRQRIETFVASPSHALMIVGPTGSGKHTLAAYIAEELLGLPVGRFEEHPYALSIVPEGGKAIGIESVRRLEHFLALKVPGKAPHDRVIIIEDAQTMTLEAQNALLKMLEEPPAGTVVILTVNHEQTVLPTIRSRVQSIAVGRLDRLELESYFNGKGFDPRTIGRAYGISGGLPGLMNALLDESEHPLMTATERARELLGQSAYERLASVDELAKQRALAMDVTVILQQMARLGLQKSDGPAAKRWQAVLKAAYEAGEALAGNAQPKLALTKLMLSL